MEINSIHELWRRKEERSEKNQQGLNMGKRREKGVCSVDFENIIWIFNETIWTNELFALFSELL